MNRPLGFFKTMFATVLGVLVALFFIFLFFLIIGISNSGQPEPYISRGSVLKIQLSGLIPETDPNDPFEELFNPGKAYTSLSSMKNVLRNAALDQRVSGLWLEFSPVFSSWAVLEELREELLTFKGSGKFLYASTNDIGFNEPAYFLATTADSIFSPPESFFEFDGFVLQTSFYHKMFEKVGIEPEIARTGSFKAAVEPYIQEKFSRENEQQLQNIVDIYADVFLSAVEEFTGFSRSELNEILNESPRLTASYAIERGLISRAAYPSDVEGSIKDRLGKSKLNTVDFKKYAKVSPSKAGREISSSSDKIAVLRLSGLIAPAEQVGPGADPNMISVSRFEEAFEDIEKDDNIKAVVLRIDSPGGSGSTSDIIWKRLREFSKTKPLIASMVGVAASGGYYIAMAADTIVAMPSTITGSIGVFSTKFNAAELLNEKIGITYDEVTSHRHSNWFDVSQPFTKEQAAFFQRFNDNFYDTFISKVALSRGLSKTRVNEIGQGRVWTGRDALELGLVDVLGGLDQSLGIAADMASLESYSIMELPKKKSPIEVFMELSSAQAQTYLRGILLPEELNQAYNTLDHPQKYIQAILPVELSIR